MSAVQKLVYCGLNGCHCWGHRRQRRQEAQYAVAEAQGGVVFSGCVDDLETGLCRVEAQDAAADSEVLAAKKPNCVIFWK